MAAILHTRIPTLDADLDTIIRTAKDKNAKVIEDFFDALPDGHVKDSAHQIIFGWYAGVVDESPTADVFAYEEALMYQPTKDAVALPTYSFNGPNHWTDVDPPLSAMPEFRTATGRFRHAPGSLPRKARSITCSGCTPSASAMLIVW